MTSDLGVQAGRDWTEREARFVVDNDRFLDVADALDSDPRLGPYSLGELTVEEHDDTYFDTQDYDLHEAGWSLRIRRGEHRQGRSRERSTWITLKLPDPGEDDEKNDSQRRREIENTGYEDFHQVFFKIVLLLQDKHIIRKDRDPTAFIDAAISRGIGYALESAGLQDLFTVTTGRHSCPVREAGEGIATLSLDDSNYRFQQVVRDDSERQCRMEVELHAGARDELLTDIADRVRERFSLLGAKNSKFEHGMILYRGRKLLEKFEVKIIIPEQAVHGEIAKKISRGAEFMPGYLFDDDGTRHLRDVYFDTSQQDLFMAGCYLRLRKDGSQQDLKFRLLHFDTNVGDAVQYEVAAKEGADDFGDRWEQIQSWLGSVAGTSGPKKHPGSLDRIAKPLAAMGLRPVLEVGVDRVAWSVLKAGAQKAPKGVRGELIARLKYDKITFYRPGDKHGQAEVQFEVAGAEDHEAAPRILRRGEYYTFLRAFTTQCRKSAETAKIGWEINAKYFEGMIKLGLHRELPDWYGTHRTQLSMPMRREAPAGSPAHDTDDDQSTQFADGEGAPRGETRQAIRPASLMSPAAAGNNANSVFVYNLQTSQQINAAFGGYGMAFATELDKMYDHILPTDLESARTIQAAKDAVTAGDSASLRSGLQSLGGKFWEIAKQVSIPVLTLFLENRLGLKS